MIRLCLQEQLTSPTFGLKSNPESLCRTWNILCLYVKKIIRPMYFVFSTIYTWHVSGSCPVFDIKLHDANLPFPRGHVAPALVPIHLWPPLEEPAFSVQLHSLKKESPGTQIYHPLKFVSVTSLQIPKPCEPIYLLQLCLGADSGTLLWCRLSLKPLELASNKKWQIYGS